MYEKVVAMLAQYLDADKNSITRETDLKKRPESRLSRAGRAFVYPRGGNGHNR